MEKRDIDLENFFAISRKPYFLKKNLVAPKKFNFPYIRYRLLRPVLKNIYRAYHKFGETIPWTSPASIEIFKKSLNKNHIGFEWGSGSSTFFFAKRIKELISVEHNQQWYQKVSQQIQQANLSNVHLKFIHVQYPEKHLDKDGFQVAATPSQVEAYKEYYSFIDQYPDNYFDFILIDGRTRVQCGKHAIPKLKPGGMLVLDNSERARYQELKNMVKDWPSVWTTTGLTDTTIWIKP